MEASKKAKLEENWKNEEKNLGDCQCDQIELFLCAPAINFVIKGAQISQHFLGTFDNITLYNKKRMWLHFGQLLGKIVLLFFLTSGHTGDCAHLI